MLYTSRCGVKMYKLKFIFILFVTLIISGNALAEKRVALVIGNNDYTTLPDLNNAEQDATDMAAKLRQLGFEVILKINASEREMTRAKRAFEGKLSSSQVGLVFYAGHGIQADGKNYLIPSDAQIEFEDDLEAEGIEAKAFLDAMDRAGTGINILILDACRDNPLPTRSRSAARGLAVVGIPKNARGTAVLYSAGEGQTAQDGPRGGNGVFTGEFLKVMDIPGLTLEQVFKRVARGVGEQTNGKQRPWSLTSLQGDFYFKDGKDAATKTLTGTLPAGGGVNDKALDLAFWNAIKDSTDAADFGAYLRQYPSGSFVELARVKSKRYGKKQAVVVKLPTIKQPADIVSTKKLGRLPTLDIAKVTPEGDAIFSGTATSDSTVVILNNDMEIGRVNADTRGEWVFVPDKPVLPGSSNFTLKMLNSSSFRDCDDCPEMVVIPPGSFRMGDLNGGGDDDEKPVHTVNINYSFAVGKYEVIQGQWWGYNPSEFEGDNNPVEMVSWDGAQRHVQWLSSKTGHTYRLLSEAEWEYVARAGTTTRWNCGDSQNCLNDVAWYESNSARQTHPVGQKSANAFGVHDMHGNVWEWVEDCYEKNYNNAPANGAARKGSDFCHRIVRGGSWISTPGYPRSANRVHYSSNRLNTLGFRVARDLSNAEAITFSAKILQGGGAVPSKSESRAETNQTDERDSQVRSMVESLASRMRGNPDDEKGWALLEKSYRALGETAKADAAAEHRITPTLSAAVEPVFHQFSTMLVNLKSTGGRSSFLKLTFTAQLESADDLTVVKNYEPKIINEFQLYLRELTVDDLKASEGIAKMRNDFIDIVQRTTGNDKVKDIFIKELLVQ